MYFYNKQPCTVYMHAVSVTSVNNIKAIGYCDGTISCFGVPAFKGMVWFHNFAGMVIHVV